MSFLAKVYANRPLANVCTVVVLMLGVAAYLLLPRERDPEINFNWVNITTALPGASAEDVERLVTDPLEEALAGVSDVRFVVSTSRENVSNILVRFQDLSEREFDKRINDLRREIQSKTNDELPEEVRDPDILEITSSNGFPTALVLVVGQADDETLRASARRTRQDIERISAVDQVAAQGLHQSEFKVLFDPSALAARGLLATDLANAVSGWFQDVFAGRLRVDDGEWLIRTRGREVDPERLADASLVSPLDGSQLALEDVARISRERARPTQRASHNGQPAVLLSINKRPFSNTLDLISDLNDYIEARNPVLAEQGIKLILADDQTIPTREAIAVMRNNAVLGLLLVLAVCWLFLGGRVSLLVSLGLVFCITAMFAVLFATGNTLNITVLLGIVIALGMLVDVSVVMVEAMVLRLRQGVEGVAAALAALREVAIPLSASVLTTIAAFLPLMLLPGIVGKFMFIVPFVVTVGLLISLVYAFWIMPSQVAGLRYDSAEVEASDRVADHWRARFIHRLRIRYVRWLVRVMRRPVAALSVASLTFVAAVLIVVMGWVRQEFFAFDPMRFFYVNVDMPVEANIDETLRQVEIVEQIVRQQLPEGEARSVSSMAGIKFTDVEPVFGVQYGQVIVSLNPGGRTVDAVVEGLREHVEAAPVDAAVSFLQLSGGPPVQRPINVKVRSDDFAELRAAADAVRHIIAGLDGTRDITDDDVPGRPELLLELDRAAIRHAGLDPHTVSRLLRLHVDGEILAITRDAGDKVELRVQADRGPSAFVDEFLNDPVAMAQGNSTHLGALMRAEPGIGRGMIRHYNFRRAITVEADIDRDITDTISVNRAIEQAWQERRQRYPGADLDFSGELDDIEESLDAMLVLFLLGIGLIYLILATQFGSYFQPLLILTTVPMAFTGVVAGLWISGNPLSLYTLYGVIALTGIAVNAAIVLIDAANQRLAAGMRPLHATVYAARRRVVPILMTTATTIAGLLSLALGLGGRSLLWGPVAVTLVWGLTVSAVLTLFIVPLLYRLAMRQRGGQSTD